ncbi:MAG TPA: 30S ribosomal protein S16 [Candidatus Megaira endosymbiont of Hartmannula sinica]|nr:30S ribosomal protein S16 [Candidatus Megaera endosymbiont of Hartmannula sinica]
MAVKIRLARGGAKKRPYYRIVVAKSESPRDGKFIEKLGTYNPMLQADSEQRIVIHDQDRVDYWFKNGAIPTDRVAKMFKIKNVNMPEFITRKMMVKEKNFTIKKPKKELKEG